MNRLSFKHLQLAVSFYTRLPCGKDALDYTQLPQAALYLPVVGWIVGGCTAFAFYVAALLWSQVTAVIIALGIGMVLTGALHEDGFADVCDGFGGGWGKTRILAIMKDSHIGVYGVLGLMLLLSLKISVLSNMPTSAVPSVLLASHSVSRFMPLLLMYGYNYARNENSKAAGAVYKPHVKELFGSAGFASLPLLVLPVLFCLAILPILFVNYWLGRYFYRHIGGYTGDCLGASQQIAEVVFYLSVSNLWTFF
jgi:adenosylcobinamide-GDP ribazoletransferase